MKLFPHTSKIVSSILVILKHYLGGKQQDGALPKLVGPSGYLPFLPTKLGLLQWSIPMTDCKNFHPGDINKTFHRS